MKKTTITSLLVLCSWAGIALPQMNAGESFTWMEDLEEARNLAEKQAKPLLIVYRCVP